MIAEKLTEPVFWVLAAAAILNITQRKHLAHCGKKRMATLYWAGLIFALYVIVIAIAAEEVLPDILLIPGLLIVLAAVFLLRKKTFPFRFKCGACGKRLSFERFMYYDSNMCSACDPEPDMEPAGSAEQDAAPAGDDAEKVSVPDSVDEVDWESWKFTEQAVICYIKEGGRLLLMHKKTGLGAGKVNAPGGRIEPGEMPVETAVRETQEEVGLTPVNPVHAGDLYFIFKNGHSIRGFVYTASEWEGELTETDEADPFWCALEEIPYDRMWADDALWLPAVLDGKHISGRFIFDDDKMLSHNVTVSQAN